MKRRCEEVQTEVKMEWVITKYVERFEQRYPEDSPIYNQYLNAIQKIELNRISREHVGNVIKPFLYRWGKMGRILGQNKSKDWESNLAREIQLNSGKLQNLARQRFLGADLGQFKSDIIGCYESLKKAVGPIAAAKVLHLICPNFFPLWDNDIAKAVRDELREKSGKRAVRGLSGGDYYEFMRALQGFLKKHGQVISDLSQLYGKNDLKIMDEFLWWATHRPLSFFCSRNNTVCNRGDAMVYKTESIDVPPEVASILAQLNEMESVLMEEPRAYVSGEKIVKRIFRSKDELGHRINIIPGGVPGRCQPTLLVAVGSSLYEDVEKRILQAYVHVSNLCLATTTLVIFWAARWDAKAWMRYAGCFKNVVVILKLFGADAIRLK